MSLYVNNQLIFESYSYISLEVLRVDVSFHKLCYSAPFGHVEYTSNTIFLYAQQNV